MSKSQGFELLHEGVQRWIWQQNWNELRDIQERAIGPILKADCDVVISASTAAGKTEAAFLPACSLMKERQSKGISILYVSPLKALINDQYRRLQSLCEILDVPVTPWHGDISQSQKNKQFKNPSGILLITPESLESLLLNRGSWCVQAFGSINQIIIDEFHAFIGTERGCQLQSLMHRLEFMLERTIPRIALSATLGDMQQVAHFLRPNQKIPCEIIESTASHSDLKIQLRGYLEPASLKEETLSAFSLISNDLYMLLRGRSNLVFANSRNRTEELAASLSDACEHNNVPNEFFPHHGSLSKDIRGSLESRLQTGALPTTAVCTMTLELGIDIGNVDSIAQVTAPHSVASLRQRLGRSGRREEAAILRMFIPESEITDKSHLFDQLRFDTIQSIAMVSLLLKKWYEPSPDQQYHLSTLVQQTLSVIAQYGGVRASQLWSLLCDTGPFHLVNQSLFGTFLRTLAEHSLITQMQDGQLVLGYKGEKLVGHFSFYTAFNTPEEYRLEFNGRILGTLPIDSPLLIDQHIIFAGKRWNVVHVDAEKKLISLIKAAGGKPPKFGGNGQNVHDIVRQEMLKIFISGNIPIYLDETAKTLFSEGIECFHKNKLNENNLFQAGNTLYIFPWLGDRVINTISILLRREGFMSDAYGGIIEINDCTEKLFRTTLASILAKPKPDSFVLAQGVEDTIIEKHDYLLSNELSELNYGAKHFDIDAAWNWFLKNCVTRS
ncbi:MAG: DEAD/DEAH box helicase [Pseudomonadota bacterium]